MRITGFILILFGLMLTFYNFQLHNTGSDIINKRKGLITFNKTIKDTKNTNIQKIDNFEINKIISENIILVGKECFDIDKNRVNDLNNNYATFDDYLYVNLGDYNHCVRNKIKSIIDDNIKGLQDKDKLIQFSIESKIKSEKDIGLLRDNFINILGKDYFINRKSKTIVGEKLLELDRDNFIKTINKTTYIDNLIFYTGYVENGKLRELICKKAYDYKIKTDIFNNIKPTFDCRTFYIKFHEESKKDIKLNNKLKEIEKNFK